MIASADTGRLFPFSDHSPGRGVRFLPAALLFALAVLLLGGCTRQLDDKWHETNEAARAASRDFAKVVRVYASAADQMAGKKHDLQAAERDAAWRDFVARHTGPDGRLVSRDEKSGEIKPLLAVDLTAAIEAREQRSALLERSRSSWSAVHAPLFESIGRFEAMIELSHRTEGDVLEAKRSIQALAQDGAAFIGGVLSAAGFVAAVP